MGCGWVRLDESKRKGRVQTVELLGALVLALALALAAVLSHHINSRFRVGVRSRSSPMDMDHNVTTSPPPLLLLRVCCLILPDRDDTDRQSHGAKDIATINNIH